MLYIRLLVSDYQRQNMPTRKLNAKIKLPGHESERFSIGLRKSIGLRMYTGQGNQILITGVYYSL